MDDHGDLGPLVKFHVATKSIGLLQKLWVIFGFESEGLDTRAVWPGAMMDPDSQSHLRVFCFANGNLRWGIIFGWSALWIPVGRGSLLQWVSIEGVTGGDRCVRLTRHIGGTGV